MEYACTAEAKGKGRCRHLLNVEKPSATVRCSQHKTDGSEAAKRPDEILVKVNVGHEMSDELRSAGVRYEPRKNRAGDHARHIEEAARHGRNPGAFRDTPDSGTPVFGKSGTGNCSLAAAFDDMGCDGYRVTDFKLEPAGKPNRDVLIVVLKPEGEQRELPLRARRLLFGESGSPRAWQYCHIWSNPPDPRKGGIVNQTINIAGPLSRPNPERLRFAQGLWLFDEEQEDDHQAA